MKDLLLYTVILLMTFIQYAHLLPALQSYEYDNNYNDDFHDDNYAINIQLDDWEKELQKMHSQDDGSVSLASLYATTQPTQRQAVTQVLAGTLAAESVKEREHQHTQLSGTADSITVTTKDIGRTEDGHWQEETEGKEEVKATKLEEEADGHITINIGNWQEELKNIHGQGVSASPITKLPVTHKVTTRSVQQQTSRGATEDQTDLPLITHTRQPLNTQVEKTTAQNKGSSEGPQSLFPTTILAQQADVSSSTTVILTRSEDPIQDQAIQKVPAAAASWYWAIIVVCVASFCFILLVIGGVMGYKWRHHKALYHKRGEASGECNRSFLWHNSESSLSSRSSITLPESVSSLPPALDEHHKSLDQIRIKTTWIY